MNARTPDTPPQPDRYERARSEEEPGAHSGSESQARDRVVPGTASAKEGYQQGGTGGGEPLAGVEATGDEDEDDGEGSGGDEDGARCARDGAGEGAGEGAHRGTAGRGRATPAITREHVRALLDAPGGAAATLVMVEGRAEVVPSSELGTRRYAGAVEVMSGGDLARSAGHAPESEADLDALAARLEAMVELLGA